MKRFAIAVGLLALVMCGLASVAQASITVYTSESSFLSRVYSGYYQENFDYAPWLQLDNVISTPQSFSGPLPTNTWAYQISSPTGLSGTPVYGAPASWTQGNSITVTFSGTLPTAVGGIFWATDINGDNINNATVHITLASGGTFSYDDASNYSAFTGFVSPGSPISSMTLTASGAFAEIDNFDVGQAIPEPATIVIWSLLGAGLFGLKVVRRKGNEFGGTSRPGWSEQNRVAIRQIIEQGR